MHNEALKSSESALIFNIQDYAVNDGPGIRSVIFFKGCPLRCLWCANPEGQEFYPEIMHSQVLCKACGRCVATCPYEAIAMGPEGYPVFQREKCKNCTEKPCEKACLARAIRLAGKYWTVEELFQKVKTNGLFYRNSDGGVTLSGGEPLAQPEFVQAFLSRCESIGLSVGVETSGMFVWERVRGFIEKLDFFYFDLKAMNLDTHYTMTGIHGEQILENLKRLAEVVNERIIIAWTVIPGVNDSLENLHSLSVLCNQLGITRLRLLPYHTLGVEKYSELGREYQMPTNVTVNSKKLQQYMLYMREQGIDCWIE